MVRAWWGECGHYWSGENGSTHSFVEDDEENIDILPSSNTHKHKQKTPIEDAIDWGQNDSVLLFNIFIASVEQEGLFNEQLVNPKHKQDKQLWALLIQGRTFQRCILSTLFSPFTLLFIWKHHLRSRLKSEAPSHGSHGLSPCQR